MASRSTLHLLHIVQHDAGGTLPFPQVRRLLVQWGLAEETDPPWVISEKLGFSVDSTTVKWQDPAEGIAGFLEKHPSELIVLATHGRSGIERWLKGSVSEAVFRRFMVPALFLTQGARGFVSQVNGDIQLRRVLVPIDVSPAPSRAIGVIEQFARLLTGADATVHLLHVGDSAPPLRAASPGAARPRVILRSGNVVKSIVDAAIEFDVDLIGMPTAGHHGVLDALRGSTTERVVRHAPCPVLSIPVV